MESTQQATDFISQINKLWPIILFILGIIWKQIISHFDVLNLKDSCSQQEKKIERLELKNDLLEEEFNKALKEHIIENKASFDKLTEAITELIKSTTILTVKIEMQNQKLNEN